MDDLEPEPQPTAGLDDTDLFGGPVARRIALRLVQDESEADDLLQDLWLKTRERPPGKIDHPQAWLASAVRNLQRTHNRGGVRRRHREEVSSRTEHLPSAEELVSRKQICADLQRAVSDLGPPLAEVIQLRYLEGLSAPEVAAQLDRPLHTVRTHTRRGLDRLRTQLDGEYGSRRAWSLSLVGAFEWTAEELPQAGVAAGAAATAGGIGWLARLAPLWISLVAVGGLLLWRPWQTQPTTPEEALLSDANTPDDAPPDGNGSNPDPPLERSPLAAADADLEETPESQAATAPPAGPVLAVRVVDPQGRPVEGAELLVATDGTGYDQVLRARSNASGAAQLPIEPSDWHSHRPISPTERYVWITAKAEGRTRSISLLIPESQPGGVHELVVGEADLTLFGQVSDHDGLPVSDVLVTVGANVTAYHSAAFPPTASTRFTARSDEDGLYEIAGALPGDQFVTAFKDGWPLQNLDFTDPGGARLEVNIQFGAPSTLRGRVLDSDGQPLANVQVIAEPRLNIAHFAPRTYSAADGSFELTGLRLGSNALWAYADGGGWDFLEWSPNEPTVREHDFRIRTDRMVRVRVIKPNGDPVVGAEVKFNSLHPVQNWIRRSATDADGRTFANGAPDAPVQIIVASEVTGAAFPQAVLVLPKPDDEVVIHEMVSSERPDEFGVVRGTLVQHDQNPWPDGALLRLVNMEMGAASILDPDPQTGAFEDARVPAGSYKLDLEVDTLGKTTLGMLEIGPSEELDMGQVLSPRPGTLKMTFDFPGDPAQYSHRVLNFMRLSTGKLTFSLVSEGAGPPPETLQVFPGQFGVRIGRGAEELLRRSTVIYGGRSVTMPLGKDVPSIGSVALQPPPDCHAETVVVRLKRYDEDPGLPPASGPAALIDAFDARGEAADVTLTLERGADGIFCGNPEFVEGHWVVLARSADGWGSCSAFHLTSRVNVPNVALQLQRLE